MCTGGTDARRENASGTLRNLSLLPEHRPQVAQANGIPPLVEFVTNGSDGMKEHAAAALWALCAGNVENRVSCAKAGAIEPLMKLCKQGVKDVVRENAAGALVCAATQHGSTLHSPPHNPPLPSMCVQWRLCIENNDNQKAVEKGGAIISLVQLLKGTDPQKVNGDEW